MSYPITFVEEELVETRLPIVLYYGEVAIYINI